MRHSPRKLVWIGTCRPVIGTRVRLNRTWSFMSPALSAILSSKKSKIGVIWPNGETTLGPNQASRPISAILSRDSAFWTFGLDDDKTADAAYAREFPHEPPRVFQMLDRFYGDNSVKVFIRKWQGFVEIDLYW